jgi:hypothetical protein
MGALLLALVLARPAAALDAEAPGAPAQRAKAAIETLPVETRAELRRMYLHYREEVGEKKEQGWKAGVLSDAVIENVDEPFQPARLLEDEERSRRRELSDLEAALAATRDDAPEYPRILRRIEQKKDEFERARTKAAREKGICRDWSDDVWSLLTAMNLENWTVDDRRRSTRPFHTGAVACSPQEDPTVCLVFDPWVAGSPAIYAFQAWDAKEAGGRLPAEYFLHGLPEKAP